MKPAFLFWPLLISAGFAAHGKTLTDDMPNYTRDVILQIGEMVIF
jgi:hypothetical protein